MSTTVALNAEAFGDGAPLLILHGLFGSARNWRSVAKTLSQSYSVYTIDLRNHGSSPHADAMSYSDMAADVVRFLDDRELECATIVGHSMGGKTAFEVALGNPERVAHLIAVDIAPTAYDHDYSAILSALTAMPLDQIQRRADANRMLEQLLEDESESDLRLFLLQNLVIQRDQAPHWRINLAAIRASIDQLVGHQPAVGATPYTGPCDFIRGAQSPYVPAQEMPRFQQWFPRAELHTVTEAGHWPHAQNPQEFIACLQTILASH